MRVVFMGTPTLAAGILEAVSSRHEVVGVFSRPDAVRGRGKKLAASPVKLEAEARGLPVFTPETLKSGEAADLMKSLNPDVVCVAAYGAILPPSILEVPSYGCLNVHTSLLPRWRGAAPIERAIMERDDMTGVCVMLMEEGLDTGPYCVRKTTPVGGKYLGELASELSAMGAEALLDALGQVEGGTVSWTPQGSDGLTYASKIGKGELNFGPDELAEEICAKVRASNDSHPSRIELAGKRVAVQRANVLKGERLSELADGLEAGSAAFAGKRLLIGAADGVVELKQVKPEGKKGMEGRAFAAGIQGIKNMQVTWGRA